MNAKFINKKSIDTTSVSFLLHELNENKTLSYLHSCQKQILHQLLHPLHLLCSHQTDLTTNRLFNHSLKHWHRQQFVSMFDLIFLSPNGIQDGLQCISDAEQTHSLFGFIRYKNHDLRPYISKGSTQQTFGYVFPNLDSVSTLKKK